MWMNSQLKPKSKSVLITLHFIQGYRGRYITEVVMKCFVEMTVDVNNNKGTEIFTCTYFCKTCYVTDIHNV